DLFVAPPPSRTGLYVIDSVLSGDLEALRSSLAHLVLPALTLGYFSTAVIARMTRSSMLDVLGQDYIRAARAKGPRGRLVGWRHGPLLANPLNLLAIVLIALFALGAVLAAIIAPYDPIVQALGSRLDPPSAAHWLGTDQLGRDIASRLLYGARISLFIGLVVVA